MKLSTGIIILLLGVIAVMIFDELDRQRGRRNQVEAMAHNSRKMELAKARGEDVSDFWPDQWSDNGTRLDGTTSVSPPVPGDASPVTTPQRTPPLADVQILAVVAVRGVVVGPAANGYLIDCDVTAPALSMPNYRGSATDGAADIARAANAAQRADERSYFGDVQRVTAGRVAASDFRPGHRASGRVVLTGISAQKGQTIHVVAAPTGRAAGRAPIYSAEFTLASGAWMYQRGGRTALDRR